MTQRATETPARSVPVVAVVGRPNVGKSTLVNRIIGRREAVVQDVPGVTRDRVSYDATGTGGEFVLVDTGGWAPDAKGMAAQITEQAELAIAAADAVLFVVDATVGTQDVDEAVVQVLRRSKQAGRARGEQGRRPAQRGRSRERCGTSGWGSRTRCRPCTAGGVATCWTRSWTAIPDAPREALDASVAGRAGWRSSASRMSASPAC